MNRQLRFCLKESHTPTYYNLCRFLKEQNWRPSRFKWRADFSEDNFQFDLQAAQQLEFKHLLAQLAARHCPEVMPLTYCINDQNWPQVLEKLDLQNPNLIWILKPALLNNGKEIKLFQNLSDLQAHFISSKRLGGEHVLQHYVANPHLLRDRRKYSIRMFVVTTNYGGNFLYPFGYYNVALHPYAENDFSELKSHLTNEHLQINEANVLQIPAQRFADFESLYPQIKAIVTAIITGLEQEYPQAFICKKTRTLAIYGFDFLVDSCDRVWLLEANHGPCFPISAEHSLQKFLYHEFWQHFIANFVIPIALDQSKETIQNYSFELLETTLK
ncbi:MAG: tubulin-tyrosine ligase [Tatlockia sp.]|nr:tubulin-tyrosine ligase [Tatlockia sp.]